MKNKWTRVLKAEEDLIQIGWDLNFEYYHEPSGNFMSLYDISSTNAPVYNTTFNQEGYGNKEVSFEKVMEDVNKVENWFLNGGYKEFFTKIRAEGHTDDGVGGTAWVTQEQYDEASEEEGWKTSAGTFPLPNDLEYMIDSNLMISLYVYKDSIVEFEGRKASKKDLGGIKRIQCKKQASKKSAGEEIDKINLDFMKDTGDTSYALKLLRDGIVTRESRHFDQLVENILNDGEGSAAPLTLLLLGILNENDRYYHNAVKQCLPHSTYAADLLERGVITQDSEYYIDAVNSAIRSSDIAKRLVEKGIIDEQYVKDDNNRRNEKLRSALSEAILALRENGERFYDLRLVWQDKESPEQYLKQALDEAANRLDKVGMKEDAEYYRGVLKQASTNKKKIKSFNLKDIITKIQDRYHELMDIGSWSEAEWFKKGEYAYIYIPVNKFDFRKNVTTGETDKEAVKALEELSGQKVEIIKIKATIKGPYDVMTADAKPTLVDVRFEDGQVWEDVNTEWLKHEPFGEDEDNKKIEAQIEDNRHIVERISDLLDSGFEQEEIINIVCNEFECEPQEVEQFLRKVTYASKVISEREAGKDLNLAIRKANKVLKGE